MSQLQELALYNKSKDTSNIGPDPSKWVQRLLEVNEDSQFTDEQKKTIKQHLNSLLLDLDIPF